MSILKKIKDKTGTIHDLGDSRVDAFETELSGAAHNVPYSPAVLAKTNAIEASVSAHIGNTANPHKVTKAQIGLANVENKSSTQIRSELTKENVTNALGYTPIDESRIGAANGVASLDASGRIPASQIPGGFDNIEEYDNLAAFPTTGEEGKIYVAKDTNLTYRWTGSQYVEISPSLALGETATTAYRGDRGKVAYDHSQVSGNSTIHHTHANKELLDTYKQTEADLANAVSKVHEHGNKDVLDGITSDKVTSWDGKEDAFDVLPTTKGGSGTNAASKSELTSSLINSLSSVNSTPQDADYYVSQYAGGGTSNTSFVRRPVSALWGYIKDKISSVLGLTASAYSGKAATAGTADKAVADKSGSDIETTYATKSELATKQNTLKAGSGITISNSTISALNRLIPVDISNDEKKDFNNLPGENILYYKSSATAFANQPDSTSLIFIQWSAVNYYSLQLVIGGNKNIYIRNSYPNSNNDGKVWGKWLRFANYDELNAVNSSFTTHKNNTTVHITEDERNKWNAKQDALTFDAAPTAGSTNPVTSDGIKTALEVLQSNIDTVDAKGIVINEINGENVICFE